MLKLFRRTRHHSKHPATQASPAPVIPIPRSINDCLPTVLLTEVFSYILAITQNYDTQYNNSRTTLRTVCKYWNDIIVGNPKFWSTFCFDLPHQPIPSFTVVLWAQRAADLPISIYIGNLCDTGLDGPWTEKELDYRWELLFVLLEHIPRWKVLGIESAGTFMTLVQDIDFTSAQSLEQVNLYFEGCSVDITRRALLALKKAPNLTSLKFSPDATTAVTVLEDSGVVELLKRLRNLEIDGGIPASTALDIIRSCTLTDRVGISPTWVHEEPLIPASSDNLSILELALYCSEDSAVLAHLHLPNLKVLSVRWIQSGGGDLSQVVSEFISGDSGRFLEVLKLEDITIDALDSIFHSQVLTKIPIVEFCIVVPETGAGATNELAAILSEKLKRWKEIIGRCQMCLKSDTDYPVFSVGWVDSRLYPRLRQSLPNDILDKISIGLLV